MNSFKIINIGLAGCGVHSHIHALTLKNFNDVKITACCDIIADRAGEWSVKYNCKPYTKLEEMLSKEKIDAVILCTWPNQHLEQIKICLEYGVKNILCEKSLAMNGKEADEIGQLVRKHNAFLMEASMYRHHPAIRKMEEIVFNSNIGPVDSIRAVFNCDESEAHDDQLQTPDWRYKKECGGGVTHDWMSYCVSACNFFSRSKPLKVSAFGNINKQYNTIDKVYGQILYENGVVGFIESSKYACFSQMLQINCAGGIIEIPMAWGIFGQTTIFKHHSKKKWDFRLTDKYRIEEADPFYLQALNFLNVIKDKQSPLVLLGDSIDNIHTIEAVVKSITGNCIVQIDSIKNKQPVV